ncbi:MAG TPA: D-alanyl-D-alanine carboxypeptidase [Tepidimicrobium sp.]|nr:D-alanyl-D-alanine carboxypeptidase [Tepidimicrobium sp.]
MKRIVSIILVLLFLTHNISFANDLSLSGEVAVLVDGDTGQVLFGKSPHKGAYPASTTKIMTGILAIELGDMEDTVVIDDEVVQLTDGSHIALEPGERLNFEDLVYALMIQSANDAALAIAKHISGDIDEFVKLMNKKAIEIGALNTHFVNPNGLPHDEHITTAYDLTLIARYAMKNPKFREIVSKYNYEIPKTNKKDEDRYLSSNNRLLYSNSLIDVDGERVPIKYEGVTGIKTGYTRAAQNCLVASATRGDRNLIAVVLKAEGRQVYSDIHKLFNHGFDDFDRVNIAAKGDVVENIEVLNGTSPMIAGIIGEDVSAYVPKGTPQDIERVVNFNQSIEAPIEKGQALGTVEYYIGDELIAESNIVSTLDVDKKISAKIEDKLPKKRYGFALLFIILILARMHVVRTRRKRRRRSVYRMNLYR